MMAARITKNVLSLFAMHFTSFYHHYIEIVP